jgi:hypothetical protein
MLWKKSPEQLRQQELLRQWRQSRRLVNLELLPLRIVLWFQQARLSRNSEADRAASPSQNFNSTPTLPREKRKGASTMPSAKPQRVLSFLKWLNRRPCLQPLRAWLIHRLRTAALSCLVWLLRQRPRPSHGSQTR